MQAALAQSLRLCGTRFHISRSEAVHPHTPYIVISNHQSMFDIPVIGGLLFTNYPKYVSKRELARGLPSISYNLRRWGHALIDRTQADAAVAAIAQLGREQVAARGVSAVIFPEGTRSTAGVLGRFRVKGTLALLAAAPEAAVVPIAIDGFWRLTRHKLKPVPFGTQVLVNVGAPIPRHPGEDGEEILARAQAHIESALHRFREGGG